MPEPAATIAESKGPEATQAFAAGLAAVLRAGDLLILSGELGAGKTTFTQGLATGMGVRGRVSSPTFILAREHQAIRPGEPGLVHVDAYRLGGLAELDALDLDTSLDQAVTVVEWGAALAESLSSSYLLVEIRRGRGFAAHDGETRLLEVRGHGPRWEGVDLAGLTPEAAGER